MKQLIFAASLCLLPLTQEVVAQPNSRVPERVTCSSYDGHRTFCTADTRGGVRLLHQVAGTCSQDSTWGYDNRGIWVDRGCKAEFELSGGGPAGPAIPAGTTIHVRTNERIDAKKSDGRIFSGVVNEDVINPEGVVAIPRGSEAELLVRSSGNRVLVLDLESVTVNGRHYDVSAGGGAGVQLLTQGTSVRVPSESLLTFRLDQALQIGTADPGSTRRGHHFH